MIDQLLLFSTGICIGIVGLIFLPKFEKFIPEVDFQDVQIPMQSEPSNINKNNQEPPNIMS